MSRKNKQIPDLDIAGLLALRAYERPDTARAEKNIQSILREVRTLSHRPSAQELNRKLGIFAQPRYGIAALFIIFLGLHLIDRPVPAGGTGPSAIERPSTGQEIAASMETNRTRSVSIPGIEPVYKPLSGEPATFVNFRE